LERAHRRVTGGDRRNILCGLDGCFGLVGGCGWKGGMKEEQLAKRKKSGLCPGKAETN